MIALRQDREQDLRNQWASEDLGLRLYALEHMDCFHCPDIVLSVAANPMHPFQVQALKQMQGGFDRPDCSAIVLIALSHVDVTVRAAAADALRYGAPAAARERLLACAQDRHPDLAVAAIGTLQSYPSVKVIRCLAPLSRHSDRDVRATVAASLDSIIRKISIRLCGADERVAERIGRWLTPVRGRLTFSRELLKGQSSGERLSAKESPNKTMPLAQLRKLLTKPGFSSPCASEVLPTIDWQQYGARERRYLRPVLLTHQEMPVRREAARALAAWNDVAGLLELMHDFDECVRASAAAGLAAIPAAPETSATILEHLEQQRPNRIDECALLAAFVRHEERSVANRRLLTIADDPGQRESLRMTALRHLAGLGAKKEIIRLVRFLKKPPALSWCWHAAILTTVKDLGLPVPDLRYLEKVDDLFVQEALALVSQANPSHGKAKTGDSLVAGRTSRAQGQRQA